LDEIHAPLSVDEERIIRQAVMSLPPIFREVVMRRYFEDKT
jgi:DNA-directed RNA polymerase specialized sigma24 family protein